MKTDREWVLVDIICRQLGDTSADLELVEPFDPGAVERGRIDEVAHQVPGARAWHRGRAVRSVCRGGCEPIPQPW